MLKMIIIGGYVAHKIYWKRQNKVTVIPWNKFFAKGVN